MFIVIVRVKCSFWRVACYEEESECKSAAISLKAETKN